MKKYYTIKVWPKDTKVEPFEIGKYESIRLAQNDAQNNYNVTELIRDGKYMVTVRFGNPKSLAENYINMRKAMRKAMEA